METVRCSADDFECKFPTSFFKTLRSHSSLVVAKTKDFMVLSPIPNSRPANAVFFLGIPTFGEVSRAMISTGSTVYGAINFYKTASLTLIKKYQRQPKKLALQK